MDKGLYVAMTGARASLQAQGSVAHNLANADTKGFKAALAATQAFPIQGPGLPSRVDAMLVDPGFNASAGARMATGRNLDVALPGDNWLAVQAADGSPAYTRNGELSITPNGQLVTASGHPLLDENGNPLAIPPAQSVEIGNDGTVSIIPQGEGPQTMATVGRLRVVDASQAQLLRGPDGLMRTADPQQALPAATGSSLQSGVLEGSNVDAAGALVQMIQLQRQFEMQVKVIRTGDDMAQSSNTLLRLGG
ncbi:flagellar basal body rod protein FlgF [Pseudoxanthomonas dokdonensis]|uniref:Flagellar basal-body rod protein FlgF n=1 Tax=Pseudoxanthomonas dokdonensis TaxID=344882 RepID=A0A0R0CMW0_9GAMM|nr:flagellar basal body rod protein FlgF [Pseudoxanthomonas dokdonensis]KRG71013.1 flagellar basal body rod protein FlgF [Pseudoxanthomonas dokdonensis]